MTAFKPLASADDVWVYDSDGTPTMAPLNGVSLQVGWYSSAFAKMGMGIRFPNVTIAKDTIIQSAVIAFTSYGSSAVNTVKGRFHGEKVADASEFTNIENYAGRARTTASVDWDAIEAFVSGNTYNSPELKTIIQEIVNQAGWVSGNDLVIFFDDADDRSSHVEACRRMGNSYDADPNTCPILTITLAPTTNISKVSGVAYASIKKISGVAIASVKKVAGVA